MSEFVLDLTASCRGFCCADHWGVRGTSDFQIHAQGDNRSLPLRGIIHDAVIQSAGWRAEGASRVIEANVGRVIGMTPTGQATSWIRVVTNEAGEVITAYPIPPR